MELNSFSGGKEKLVSVAVSMEGDSTLVKLAGEAGLAQAAEFKAAMTAEVLASQEVRIDLAELSSLDMSLLQLIHALRCGGRARGRKVRRVSAVQPAVAQAAADAGAAGLGCGRACGEATCVFEEY